MERKCVSSLLALSLVISVFQGVRPISSDEKILYKNKVLEMFFHAYHSYMDHAYPADELMPLTCKGRVRGRDKNRGDIDDALGMFSLTLVDTLDTLAVLGEIDEFNSAIKTVVRDVTFDRDVVVSVFETNIRMLGGLLGAHFAAQALKMKGHPQLSWYNNHLLRKAQELGKRLLPAFNTSTGLPYPKVNLRHGMHYHNYERTTCTACAGTLLLEFAALSRLTGDPEFEVKAHHAMEVLWQSRHHGHNLLGTVINVHNGEWMRRDSGVGAGSDSYYEYCLKSYILFGDQEYLKRFELHYGAIMKYIANGPTLVDVNMNSPTRMTRTYMDSLLAFWPGLQVLWGDVDAAIHTHDMLYHVTERHNFLPEAFTLDYRVHWASHPLRPEFSESTYFLYRATGDPYYLDVGKTIVDNLNEYARVSCGFAAIKDLRNNEHEDRMDSFVLAETFKYLFLLFAEEEDVPLDMDDFVFSTEAHIFPLSLASFNSTLNRVIRNARIVMRSSSLHPLTPPEIATNSTGQSNSTSSTSTSTSSNSDNDKNHMTQTTPNTTPQESNSGTPSTGVPSSSSSPSPSSNESETDASKGVATPSDKNSSLAIKALQCPNEYRPFVLQDQFEKLVLKQCTSSRFRTRPVKRNFRNKKRTTPPRLNINTLDFSNIEHLMILKELGIVVEPMGDGRVQVSHVMQKAKTPEDAEEGWFLMQDIMKFMTAQGQQEMQRKVGRMAKLVEVLHPKLPDIEWLFEVGPALFGPDLGNDIADLSGELHVLAAPGGDNGTMEGGTMGDGCQVFSEEEMEQSANKIVMVTRGGCLFIQKVRNAQKAGASAAIVADNLEQQASSKVLPFSMSGDGIKDVEIPSVFMRKADAQILLDMLKEKGEVIIKLRPKNDQDKEAGKKEDGGEDGKKEGEEEDGKKEGEEEDKGIGIDKLSKHLQNLMAGLGSEVVSKELKKSVEEELQKLEANFNKADSADVVKEEKKEDKEDEEEHNGREGSDIQEAQQLAAAAAESSSERSHGDTSSTSVNDSQATQQTSGDHNSGG